MSYDTILASVFGKRPIWLYHFMRDGTEWFFTSQSTDYEDGDGQVWTSWVGAHSRFKLSASVAKSEITFVVPGDLEMGDLFHQDSNFVSNFVKVYQEYVNDPDLERVTKFQGRVVASRPTLSRYTIYAETGLTELRRKGLTAVIQKPCRHALYHRVEGIGCPVVHAEWEESMMAVDVTGSTVTLLDDGGFSSAYFSGGIFRYGTRRQMIVKHSGNTLDLLSPIPGFKELVDAVDPLIGLEVGVAPGCNLTRSRCSQFGALDDFGGYPWADASPFDGRTSY